MMDAAAKAVIGAILRKWPGMEASRPATLVLCGPGNNGGDGHAVAWLLHGRGWPVRVEPVGHDPHRPRPPEATEMQARWQALAAGDGERSVIGERLGTDERPILVIDAILGIGRPRPFDLGPARAVWDAAPHKVAIDSPTGLDTDTGIAVAPRLAADLTVTFHAAKQGHYLADGPALSGDLVVADLGMALSGDGLRLGTPDAGRLAKTGGHKFDHGHAVVLSGPSGHGGAARMSARAALRTGAGLVTLLSPRSAMAEHAARLDAIMLREVEDARDLSALLEDARIRAVCLGPGLGIDRAAGLLQAVLAAGKPAVIDADALTALARNGMMGALHSGCVLTPHQGEFARLFPDLADAMSRDPAKGAWPVPKPDAVRAAARRAGCTVLLKGHDTVIADPRGAAVLVHSSHGRAAPWLATAGAGDVLAGIVAGLLARGMPPMGAAETGAWLHVEAARTFGPGLIAEDLPETLPAVFRKLEA